MTIHTIIHDYYMKFLQKFLIDGQGRLVERFDTMTDPLALQAPIEALLPADSNDH